MTERTLTLKLTTPDWIGSALRMIATTVIGGVIGMLVAQNIAVFNAIPILAGLTLGIMAGSPWRPRTLEDGISRGALAAGFAFLAGEMFSRVETEAAWTLAVVGIALAVGVAGKDARSKTSRFIVAAASAGLAFLAVFGLFEISNFRWVAGDILGTGLISALVGGVTWLGTRVGAARDGIVEPKKPARFALEHMDGRDFADEYEELCRVAERVQRLLTNLELARPDEAAFVERIRESVTGTMQRSEDAVARWRMAGKKGRDTRIEKIRQRVAENEARLVEETNVEVRRELQATLTRQRRTLSAHERVEAGRRTFGFRLQQVQAGLEMLELSIEQTMTGSRDLDALEVEGIIEAMRETDEVLDADLESVQAELDASARLQQLPMPVADEPEGAESESDPLADYTREVLG